LAFRGRLGRTIRKTPSVIARSSRSLAGMGLLAYGRIQGICRKISASVLYMRPSSCPIGAGVARTGAGAGLLAAAAGAAWVTTRLGIDACLVASRVVGRTTCRGVGRCDVRAGAAFGDAAGPPSIAETTTCDRAFFGASSRSLPAAAARSRCNPSSTIGPLLLQAPAPIKAATPAIRPARPYRRFITPSPHVVSIDVRHQKTVNDPGSARSCCVSTGVLIGSVETRQKRRWPTISQMSSAARSIC
jgi:hypothetical protein